MQAVTSFTPLPDAAPPRREGCGRTFHELHDLVGGACTVGREGLLVRPGDATALQAGLETLASRSDLRERLGSHALRKAESLDLSKAVTAYLDLYEDAIAKS